MGYWKKGLLVVLFLLIAVIPVFAAQETIIVNSKDWKDVYSGIVYGNIIGNQPIFLTSEADSSVVLNSIKKENSIIVFSSKKKSFVIGYESTIKSKGFNEVAEKRFDSLSLELAKELKNISNYIIISPAYGYNAIAVAPYAIISKSYVLFADKSNIAEIEDFFDNKYPNKVTLYGHVDREVEDMLKKFNPEIININGDRFSNNIEIVKKYMEVNPVGQVLLTNGEFIESSLMSGDYPTLFIGRDNIPEKIREYVKSSDITAGVLIGNDLVGTATLARRQLGISVFVKFARSARDPQGPISAVEDLDLFFVPRITLALNITNVRYNKLTRQIEITYRNNAEVVTYFKGSYTIKEGENEQTFGDIDPVYIAANSFKTVSYDIEPLLSDDIQFSFYTIFGESKDSLEFILQGSLGVSTIELKDDTQIEFVNVYYDFPAQRFVVVIKNTGQKLVYVDTELIDIVVRNEKNTLNSGKIISIHPGASKKIYIPILLSEEDITANPSIKIRAYYGERENILTKVIESNFKLSVRKATIVTYLPTILLTIIIILVLVSITKKKCSNCAYKNHRFKKKCKKCGTDIK